MERRKFIIATVLTATALLLRCKSKTIKTISEDGYFASLKEDILHWLESVRYKEDGWGRFKYNIHMYRDYGLESSAFAIKLLNKFGELGNILDEQIDEAVSFFMDCLDPEDGFFKDPLVSEDDKVSEHLTRVVKWYWEQLPEEKRRPDEPKIKELLDAFEKHILDQETGMPTMGGCTSRNKAMAGAFKAYGSY
ncbi:MAG: hypothetical protein KAI95_19905, partial [Bacteroidales bacterium]|nr:hypothetical protein [Bacteroidales bacterium]